MVNGIKPKMRGDDVDRANLIYMDYWLAKEFGWTPAQISELENDYYEDFLHLMNLIAEVRMAQINRSSNEKMDKNRRV